MTRRLEGVSSEFKNNPVWQDFYEQAVSRRNIQERAITDQDQKQTRESSGGGVCC